MIFKDKYGRYKKTEVGFCWGILFFGIIIPIIRKDALGVIAMTVSLIGSFLLNIWLYIGVALVFAFIYNKSHIKRLLQEGYYPVEECHAKLIVAYNYVSLEKMKEYKMTREI